MEAEPPSGEVTRKHRCPLILDTDMGNDIDDALALAMVHALQSRGECELLAVTICKDNPYAPIYTDIVNTFYRRPHIPIGVVHDGVTPDDRTFIRSISMEREGEGHRFPRTGEPGTYWEAVELLRRTLAGQPDHSVVLVMIGFSTNVARLLDTVADGACALSGMELVSRKVDRVVAMAGNFDPHVQARPTLDNREFNIHRDIESARRFFHRCPRPVTFCGYEIGDALPFPAESIERDYAWAPNHPVAEAYRRYLPMPYDRQSWDQATVLEAVRPDAGYFTTSEPGRVEIDENGIARFVSDSAGSHRILRIAPGQHDRILRDIVALSAQPVVQTPVVNARAGQGRRERGMA